VCTSAWSAFRAVHEVLAAARHDNLRARQDLPPGRERERDRAEKGRDAHLAGNDHALCMVDAPVRDRGGALADGDRDGKGAKKGRGRSEGAGHVRWSCPQARARRSIMASRMLLFPDPLKPVIALGRDASDGEDRDGTCTRALRCKAQEGPQAAGSAESKAGAHGRTRSEKHDRDASASGT
jgi:hypothetical protein